MISSASGCDLPRREAALVGPSVVATSPADRDDGVTRAVTIRASLDRRIAPTSVSADTVHLRSGDRTLPVRIAIDVVRPALILEPRALLDPEITYVLEIDPLIDLDGRVGPTPASVRFHTAADSPTRAVPESPAFDTVSGIFATRCADAGCHGAADAALGLDLSSADGVRATAIEIGAVQVAPPIAGASAFVTPSLLGLARVLPGQAARSYLAYKILGDPHAPGAPMPPLDEGGGGALTDAEIALVVAWIEGGASLPGPP